MEEENNIQNKQKSNGFGVASLWCGIIGLVLFVAPYIGIFLSIIAIIFSYQQHKIFNTNSAIAGKVLGIVGVIVNIIVLLIIGIAIISFSSDSSIEESLNKQNNNNNDQNPETQESIEKISGNIEILRVTSTLANLGNIRIRIENTGNVKIRPNFDISIQNRNGRIICEGSPLFESDSIAVKGSKVDEISLLGCMFTEDGDYTVIVNLLDNNYNLLDIDSSNLTIDYWSSFGISSPSSSQNEEIIENNSGKIEVLRVVNNVANLGDIRIRVENTGNFSFTPNFDITVQDRNERIVCEGSPMFGIGNLQSSETKTTEISLLGCMFTEDGDYKVIVDLLDNNFNLLDSDSDITTVNYWSAFR